MQLTAKAPLFREQFNVDNPFTINVPRFLAESTIGYIISESCKRSGVYNRCKKEVQTSHGMRKYFMTQCEHSGMKSINVKMLLGHDIGVSGHYYRPAESDILEDYMTHAAEALTISSEHRLKKELEQQALRHSEEWGALKEEMKELKQLLGWIGDGNPAHKKEQLQRKMMDKLRDEVAYELQREEQES